MNLQETWERIGIRPWRLAVLLLSFAIVLVGAPLAVRAFFSVSGVCTEEERKVYAEFPQYGNIKKEPQPFSESGGCSVFYNTRTSKERVAEYYVEQLKAHGWTVQQRKGEVTVFDTNKRMVEQIDLTSHRDDFFYNVLFESHEMYDPPRPGAHVAVHVGKGSGNSPPSE
jgi:hypothetical protein